MPNQGQSAANAVNEEFEVGYDARFETRWTWIEHIARVIALVIVLAGLSGLLGRGPFSHTDQVHHGTIVMLEHERIARLGTGTDVTARIDTRFLSGADVVSVRFSPSLATQMGLSDTLPRPIEEKSDGQSIVATFPVAEKDADLVIHLHLKPASVGWVGLWLTVGDDTVHWHQIVLP